MLAAFAAAAAAFEAACNWKEDIVVTVVTVTLHIREQCRFCSSLSSLEMFLIGAGQGASAGFHWTDLTCT